MKVLTTRKTSESMMSFAWGLEITLCLAGLLTAFALTYIQLKGNTEIDLTFSQWAILGSAALPLIGVAFTELMKIPFTSGFLYSKSFFTKIIALTGLSLICGLTFETMLSGQEQLLNAQQKSLKTYKNEINNLNDKIFLIDNQITSLNTITPAAIREKANEGIQAQLISINEQIEDLNDSKLKLENSMNPAEIAELKRQIFSFENQIDQLMSRKTIEIENLNLELINLNSSELKELSNITFGKGRLKKEYRERRNAIKEEKNIVNQDFEIEFDKINKEIINLNNQILELSIPSEDIKTQLAILSNQLGTARLEKSELITRVNDEIERNVSLWENKQEKIELLNSERSGYQETLNQKREFINNSSDDSFIHRLAGIYYGVENLADLTEEQSGLFSLIFMISVATVVSLAGPILTYVAYSLHLQELNQSKSKLIPTIRRTFIALRKRILKPKIIKEIVEVEKEVEKIIEVEIEKKVYEKVEVPTPYEITKFVSVPVPTEIADLPLANNTGKLNGDSITAGSLK